MIPLYIFATPAYIKLTMENLDFKTFFNEKVRARGLTLKKLSDLSGIALIHLESLSYGHYEKLPAAPYLRGYIRTLGKILDFDPEYWRAHFDAMDIVRSSGARDQLPHNRYAPRPVTKYGWAIAVGVILLAYGIFRSSAILGTPGLKVNYPGTEVVSVETNPIFVTGEADGGIVLTVNGERVAVNPDGTWSKEFTLSPGLNSIEVQAKKFLGREITQSRQVVYEAARTPTEAPRQEDAGSSPLPEEKTSTSSPNP